jgi:TRAP-type C4-dicarboxylate transport system permease small subunit
MLDRLERAVVAVATAGLLLLFVLVTVQVVLRYGFNYTPFFLEEFARMGLVWSVLAAAAIGVRHRSHIAVEILSDHLPGPLRRVWYWLREVLCFLLFVLVAVEGVDMVRFGYEQTSTGLQMRLAYPYSGVPIFFAIAAIFALAALWPRRRR